MKSASLNVNNTLHLAILMLLRCTSNVVMERVNTLLEVWNHVVSEFAKTEVLKEFCPPATSESPKDRGRKKVSVMSYITSHDTVSYCYCMWQGKRWVSQKKESASHKLLVSKSTSASAVWVHSITLILCSIVKKGVCHLNAACKEALQDARCLGPQAIDELKHCGCAISATSTQTIEIRSDWNHNTVDEKLWEWFPRPFEYLE